MKELVILCVDDEDIVLKSLQRELNHTLGKKYLIETASGGEDALELFAELRQDGYDIPVVIADHIMPGMKGAELLEQIHQRSPATLTIMLTGQADMQAVTRAVNAANLYRYIAKPWDRTDLALTVREAIRRYLQEQRLTKQHAMLRDVKKVLEQKVKERTVEIERQQGEFSRLNTTTNQFFSIIARDLRNPFTGLLGITDSIVKKTDEFSPAEIKQHMLTLRDSLETVHTLIENLVTWAQLQQGTVEYQPAVIAISPILEENKLLFASQITQKRITVKNQVSKTVQVYADHRMFDTVVRNLLSNAIKFSYPGSIVTFSAAHDAPDVVVTVADRGTGITETDLPKLFQVDQKFSTPGTAGEQGTGLGLILCKALLEKHGGSIAISSEVGRGTTCTLRLPAR